MSRGNVLPAVAVIVGAGLALAPALGAYEPTNTESRAIQQTDKQADKLGITKVCLGAIRNTKRLDLVTEDSQVVQTNCADKPAQAVNMVSYVATERSSYSTDSTHQGLATASLIGGSIAVLVGGAFLILDGSKEGEVESYVQGFKH